MGRRSTASCLLALVWLGQAPTGGRADEPPAAEAVARDLARAQELYAQAEALLGQRRVAQAEAALREALVLRERALGPEHAQVATTLDGLADTIQRQGRYAEAVDVYRRALAMRESVLGAGHADVAASLNNLAATLRDMGRFEDAEPLYERAARIAESAPGAEPTDLAFILNNHGLLLKSAGRHDGARLLYERALALLERQLDPKDPQLALPLNNLAMLLLAMGQVDGARVLFERALKLREDALGPDHVDVAHCLENLARLFDLQHQPAAALPLQERVLRTREAALGAEHRLVANARLNLSRTLKALGRHEAAQAAADQGVRTLEALLGPEHPELAVALSDAAQVHYAAQRYAQALPLLERSLAIRRSTFGSAHLEVVIALDDLAWLRARQGEMDPARAAFVEAAAALTEIVRRSAGTHHGTQRLALLRSVRSVLDGFLTWAPRLGTSGYEEVLALKGLVSRSEAQGRRRERRGGPQSAERVRALHAAERRVARLANAIPPARSPEALARWRRAYAEALDERERTLRALRGQEAGSAQGGDDRAPGFPAVQAGLGPREVFVDVLCSRGRYLAWVVPREGGVARVDLGPAAPLEEACAAFVAQCRGSAPDEGASARALAALVLAPLAPHLPAGTETVRLAPDGSLAAVPLAALPGRSPGSAWLDDVLLVHASSAHDLVPDGRGGARASGALLVGAVDYERAGPAAAPAADGTPPARSAPRVPGGYVARTARLLPLDGTAGEVAALRALFGPEAATLAGPLATEEGLRVLAPGRRYLHVATHGVVQRNLRRGLAPRADEEREWMGGGLELQLAGGHDPMLLAGLAAAGVNSGDGGGGDDGFFTAAEASHLDLDGCDLVVLSACETALGTAESGEGVLGLIQGFQQAGAKAVVGSLWKVDDEATRLLMQRFYERLLDARRPVAPGQALREAARWLRDAAPGGRDFSDPRYWAAFVCYERR